MRNALSQIGSRLGMLVGAASLSSLLLIAAPQAHAASNSAFYRAELVTPVEMRRAVVRDAMFMCDGTSCMGSKANSRAAIVCASFVREFGAVTSFAAGGTALDAADLEKCNARAR